MFKQESQFVKSARDMLLGMAMEPKASFATLRDPSLSPNSGLGTSVELTPASSRGDASSSALRLPLRCNQVPDLLNSPS